MSAQQKLAGAEHEAAKRHPPSFQTVLEELVSLMSKPGVPRCYVDGAFELFNMVGKCLFVKVEKYPAPFTDDGVSILQPTDLFLHYVAAFRARDWPKVGVIEHEIRSPEGVATAG